MKRSPIACTVTVVALVPGQEDPKLIVQSLMPEEPNVEIPPVYPAKNLAIVNGKYRVVEVEK